MNLILQAILTLGYDGRNQDENIWAVYFSVGTGWDISKHEGCRELGAFYCKTVEDAKSLCGTLPTLKLVGASGHYLELTEATWKVSTALYTYTLGTEYMSEEDAFKLLNKLNPPTEVWIPIALVDKILESYLLEEVRSEILTILGR